MLLEQRRLWAGSTQLALRQHGLYLCQRQAGGRPLLEVELPYEEILPVRVERRSSVPQRQLLGLLFGTLWLAQNYLSHQPADQPLSDADWGLAFGVGAALLAFYFYGQRNWWKQFVLLTARSSVILADRSSEQAALQGFAEALERRTKHYLRQEYAQINPLGPIELQLNRLHWLQGLEVLTEAEARASATRLTGRLSPDTMHSMGQDLETPYVN
jgi:hypothetical protein